MTAIQQAQRNTTLLGYTFTRFDMTVFIVAMTLLVVIGLTVFFGIRDEGARVAYMRISENGLYQIWVSEPDEEDGGRQITDAEYGINDFDVSGDGQFIAYSERDFETGVADIYLVNLQNNVVSQLTDCLMLDSDCTAPVFRPDGEMIAYERLERNTQLSTGIGATRIWILDLTTSPPNTYPLFDDSQILGYGAEWSADSSTLAFYDNTSGGVLIYDFTAESPDEAIQRVPTEFGTTGSLSPDGSQLIFADMIIDGIQTRATLQLADLENNVFQQITNPDEPADDQFTDWSPDGEFVAIGRVYRDEERFTRGAQIYLLDTNDGSISPLVFDPSYANAFFKWSPEGDMLTMQRFRVLDEDGNVSGDGTTEVWTYDLESRKLTRLNDNAIRPRWIP